MVAKELTSLQHPLVKHLVNLRSDRAYRAQHQEVLIAGYKLVQEVSPLKQLFALKGSEIPAVAPMTFVTEAILKKITGLDHPEPLAAIAALPKESDLAGINFVVALDGVSDPGNMGNLLRTALALGWEGAYLTSGSCDPFNDKAIRAAKGASFRLPFRFGSREELLDLIKSRQWPVYIADIQGTPLTGISPPQSALLILGNEAHGVDFLFKEKFQAISIPMPGKMESLNVASAGAILMYELGRRESLPSR